MTVVHFDSYTEAPAHLKDLLDAVEMGKVATVRRNAAKIALVDIERMRSFLQSVTPFKAQVGPEAGGWSTFIPELPLSADGETLTGAIDDMIDALREYAEAWQDHLLHASHHRDNWSLVQLVFHSNDKQLRSWLIDNQ